MDFEVIIESMAKHDIDLFGRKTFFIAPDTSLIPKNYLEEFLLHGYQTYIINDDYECPMQTKINEIIRLFPDSILYFNIDASIDGIEWKTYIRNLYNSVGKDILIGIFYINRKNPHEEEDLTNYYVRNIGITAGCFALSARNHENFDSIFKVLEQTGSKGRRNLVRAKCDSSSSVSFTCGGENYSGSILDISLTHFRCNLSENSDKFKIFDKIRNISLSANGTDFTSDAVMIARRNIDGQDVCVFMFIKHDDTPELDKETEKILNQKIYQAALNEISETLQESFMSAKTK